MSKTIKYIVIGIIVLGVLALIVYFSVSNSAPGGLIAALAAGWAALKSKIFSNRSLDEQILEVEEEHALKQTEWNRVKEEYESKFKVIKARMDYLEYKSARISEQLKDLDEDEKRAIEKINNLSMDERLELLNEL